MMRAVFLASVMVGVTAFVRDTGPAGGGAQPWPLGAVGSADANKRIISYEWQFTSASPAEETTIKANMNRAIATIESYSKCIVFQEDATVVERYILVETPTPTVPNPLCAEADLSVRVGRPPAGAQWTLELNNADGCFSEGSLLHILMHMVGFYHEVQRSDVARYAHVVTANVAAAYTPYFATPTAPDQVGLLLDDYLNGIGYDLMSVMHPSAKEGLSSGEYTVLALPAFRYNQESFGQRETLSYGDIRKLNKYLDVPKCALNKITLPAPKQHHCGKPGVAGSYHGLDICLCRAGHGAEGRMTPGAPCREQQCHPPCVHGYCVGPNQCQCSGDYCGAYCEASGNDCEDCEATCSSWAQCDTGGTCNCMDYPYTDNCNKMTCDSNFQCVNGACVASGVCECPTGWAGDQCDVFFVTSRLPGTVSREFSTTPSASGATTASTAATTSASTARPTVRLNGARPLPLADSEMHFRVGMPTLPWRPSFGDVVSHDAQSLADHIKTTLATVLFHENIQLDSVKASQIQPSPPYGDHVVFDFVTAFSRSLSIQEKEIVADAVQRMTAVTVPGMPNAFVVNDHRLVTSTGTIHAINNCVILTVEGLCKNGGFCRFAKHSTPDVAVVTASCDCSEARSPSGEQYVGNFCDTLVTQRLQLWHFILIGVGSLTLIIIATAVTFVCVKKRKRKHHKPNHKDDRSKPTMLLVPSGGAMTPKPIVVPQMQRAPQIAPYQAHQPQLQPQPQYQPLQTAYPPQQQAQNVYQHPAYGQPPQHQQYPSLSKKSTTLERPIFNHTPGPAPGDYWQ